MKENMENTLEIGQHQNMEELYANVRSILASARQLYAIVLQEFPNSCHTASRIDMVT